MPCEDTHVEVSPVAPDGRPAQGNGGDETQGAGPVRERTNGLDTSLDLGIESLESVRRTDPFPVLLGELVVRRRKVERGVETLDSLGDLEAQPLLELARMLEVKEEDSEDVSSFVYVMY